MKTVTKPWGREEWIAHNELYVLKSLFIKAGFRTSLQYHKFKHETNYVDSGRCVWWLADPNGEIQKVEMTGGGVVEILPGRVHRVEALADTRLIEVSTPQVDDVIRVQDDFSRPDGRIASEHGKMPR